MKFIIVLVVATTLSSCNTMIGIGRDTKQGYHWAKGKMQGTGGGDGGGGNESYGAPVY